MLSAHYNILNMDNVQAWSILVGHDTILGGHHENFISFYKKKYNEKKVNLCYHYLFLNVFQCSPPSHLGPCYSFSLALPTLSHF